MALDITLVKIVAYEVEEFCHLYVDINPELLPLFAKNVNIKYFNSGGKGEYHHVVYYEELADQRRGVQEGFYQAFKNDSCVTTLKEMKKLLTYIAIECQPDFKAKFVSQFIEGETVIIIGW